MIHPLHVGGIAPTSDGEMLAVLVDRACMARKAHVRVKEPVGVLHAPFGAMRSLLTWLWPVGDSFPLPLGHSDAFVEQPEGREPQKRRGPC